MAKGIKRAGKKFRTFPSYKVLIITLLSLIVIILTLQATYTGLSWTGFRYYVNVQSQYLKITGATSEASTVFKDLEIGDRIVEIDGVSIGEIIGKASSSQQQLLFYPTQKGAVELSLVGNRIEGARAVGKEVLLWAVNAKDLTLDLSQRRSKTADPEQELRNLKLNKNIVLLEKPFLARFNLENLSYNSERDSMTLILAVTGVFFSTMGLFFFWIKPSRITLVYWSVNQLLCLELVVSNIDRSYIGGVEKVSLIMAGGLIGPAYLHLMTLFPDDAVLNKKSRIIVGMSYLIMVELTLIRLYFVMMYQGNEWEVSEDWLSQERLEARINRVGVLITCGLGITNLLVKYFRSEGQKRLRIRLAVFAFSFGMAWPILAIAYYVVASFWGSVIYERFGVFLLPCVIIPPIIGYAVVKNQLFGLSTAVRRFSVYLLLTLLAVASYFLISVGIVSTIPGWKSFSQDPITIALVISGLCMVLYQFNARMQRLIDKIFKFDPQDYAELVRKWNYRLLELPEIEPILEEFIFKFPQEFHYKSVSMVIWNASIKEALNYQDKDTQYHIEGLVASSLLITQGASKLKYKTLWLKRSPLKSLDRQKEFLNPQWLKSALEGTGEEEETARLLIMNTEATIVLKLEKEIYGLILLGEKSSKYISKDEETNSLVVLAHQITISLHNVQRLVREKILKEMYRDSLNHEERAREQERLNFSGLIHDDLIQRMSATKLFVGQMRRGVSSAFSEQALADMYDDIDMVIKNLRDINSALMPIHLKGSFLVGLKEFVCLKQNKYSGVRFELIEPECEWQFLEDYISIEQKINLYRFVEEATNNALKHAQATKICVLIDFRIVEQQYNLQVEVRDDGKGADLEQLKNQTWLVQNKHFGVHTMQRRIELVGGRVSFNSTRGRGMSARAILPLDGPPKETERTPLIWSEILEQED